jgi:hypothetical protein
MRVNPKTGKLSGYYRLIESYRNIDDRICHRQMLAAGFLDELSAAQLNLIQKGLNLRVEGLDNTLFAEETDPVVEAYIEQFYQQLSKENELMFQQKLANPKTGKPSTSTPSATKMCVKWVLSGYAIRV